MSTNTRTEPTVTAEQSKNDSSSKYLTPSRKPYLAYKPVKIKGELISETILRDRGSY
jgi:hypothetical protein